MTIEMAAELGCNDVMHRSIGDLRRYPVKGLALAHLLTL